ncbi:hypothetical protein OAU50_08360 [Planctomycetota bacterium]|nr:hypothetical protein [Planctomycetota bacterium]
MIDRDELRVLAKPTRHPTSMYWTPSSRRRRRRRWLKVLKPILGFFIVSSAVFVVIFVFVLDNPINTKWSKAQSNMMEIGKACNMYRLDHGGKFPASLDLLSEFYPNGVPEDPFTKKPFDYRLTKDGYILTCLGKDRAVGGDERHDKDIIVTQEGLLGND